MSDVDTINFRSLRFFIGVYDSNSFSVVARREGVSPSMISRVIQSLEDSLGQPLFYRNTRAIIPTEAGRIFIDYARSMHEQLNEVRHELQDRTREPQGLIRVNAPVYFGQKHIAPWLFEFSRRYPKVQVELIQTDDFINPHIDAADVIFRIASLADSSLHARQLGTQTYHLAASPQYVKLHGMPETPSDLTHHDCLVYSGYSGQNRWLFKSSKTSWNHQPVSPILISNNAETLLIAALNDMGVVLFPDWLIGEYLKQGKLVSMLSGFESAIKKDAQCITAIYPDSRSPPLNVRVIIDYFLEVYGDPPYWKYQY